MKGIEGFPDYYITEDGDVWSYKNNFPIKRRRKIDNKGYYRVLLYKDGKQYEFLSSRLVAKTYIPNPDNLPEVDHIDDNPLNNHITNLQWITRQGNVEKAKSKYFTIEHIASGEISEVYNMSKWCRKMGICCSAMGETYTNPKRHKSAKGYRVLSVRDT